MSFGTARGGKMGRQGKVARRSGMARRTLRVESLEAREMLATTDLLYLAAASGTQLSITSPTGPVVQIGPVSPRGYLDLAIAPNGQLYGTANGVGVSQLYEIDSTTGAGTLVSTVTNKWNVNALEFAQGVLYAAEGDYGELLRWDYGDTWVHVASLGSSQGDLAYEETTGRLYYVDAYDHLRYVLVGDEGISYDVGPIGYPNVYAMDFAGDGSLYAISSSGGASATLLQLNLATGLGTVKQTYSNVGQVWGMAATAVNTNVVLSATGGLRTSEWGASDTFTVSLSEQPLANVTIGLSSSDTTEGTVSPTSIVLTPENWNVPQTVTVTGVDDALGDGDGEYEVVLANTVSADPRYNNLSLPAVRATNADNEPPAVQLHTSAQSVSEGAGSVVLSLQLTRLAETDVMVPFTVSGTATQGTDYTITASPVLIPAGYPNGVIAITLVDDTIFEGNETIVVSLGTPTGATLGQVTAATVTIVDNDTAPAVRFETAGQIQSESTTIVTVRAVLSQTAGSAVTIPFTLSGTATGDNWDYLAPLSPLVIPAGQIYGDLTIGLVNDGLNEDDETIVITMGTPNGAVLGTPSTHTVTIVDDDPMPSVQFLTGGQTVLEGAGTVTATVQLSGVSGRAVSLPLIIEGSATPGVDFTVAANPLVIPAGQTTGSVTLNLIDDPNDEPTEIILVQLGAPTNAVLGASQIHSVTVMDNDPPPLIEFTAAVQTASEADGLRTIGVVLSAASAFPVTVPIVVGGGTAEPGGVDFQLLTTEVTIPAGQTSASVAVLLVDDTVDEPDETVIIRFGTPVNATVGSLYEHTIVISDNDAPPTVQFTLSQQTVAEGQGMATLNVELSQISGYMVSVPFTVGGSAAPGLDYGIDSSPVLIPAGQRSATINVSIVDDLLDEGDESVVVTLGGATYAVTSGITTHTLLIADNDPPPYVQWTIDSQIVDEGQIAVTLTVELSEISGLPVTLPIATTGTATGGGIDYSIAPNPIVILPGESSGSITVVLVNDSLHEADETLILTFSNPINALVGSPAATSLLILDDDPPPEVEFVSGGQSVSEAAGTVAVTARLSAPSGLPVIVPYTLTGTATPVDDYSVSPNPLVIPAGQTSASISVSLVKDLIDEDDENIILTLGTPTDATLGATSMHTITVHNAPTVQFTVAGQTVAEDVGLVTLNIRLSTASVLPVTLPLVTSGSAADADYTFSPNPVTIPAGLTEATVQIQVHDDALYEGNETAVIAFGAPVGAVVGAPSSHSLSITDNDPPPIVAFAAAGQTVVESDGRVTVTVGLSAVSGLPVTVPFTLSGTATGGDDYTITPSPLVIPAGQTTGSIALDLIQDLLDETDETVVLTLGTPTYATLGASTTHTVTVHNAPVVQWTADGGEFAEGTGSITLVARLSVASAVPVTLPFSLSGTATGGSDYQASASPIVIPAGQTEGSVTIILFNDLLDEDDETIIAALASPTNAVLGARTTYVATIIDDDPTPGVAFASSGTSVAENGGALSVTVQLSAVSGRDVWVPFVVAGTATQGADYTLSASPLRIPAGQASATITVLPINDALDEDDETVVLSLGTPVNAVLGVATTHTVTIVDDDPPPTLQFESTGQWTAEWADSVTVTVRLSTISSRGVLVPFSVSGTARPGADYAITQSPIMIPAGQTSATITISLVDDGIPEPDETVIITLDPPTFAVLGGGVKHVVTILGDGAPLPPTTIGLFDPAASTFYLRNSNTSGAPDHVFGYGAPNAGWKVLVGDWNGDGTQGVGLYAPESSTFYLTNNLTSGFAEVTFGYGAPGEGWIPLVGDWDGDGAAGVGLYDPHTSMFYLTNALQTGVAEYTFGYGVPEGGWRPIVGDWIGIGSAGVGLYDPGTSTFYLTSTLASGNAEYTFGYGAPGGGWQPIVGDWNGDGAAGVGLFDPHGSQFYLTSAFISGTAQHTFGYGVPNAGWKPLVGDWDGEGAAGVGLYDPDTSTFYLTDTLQTGVAEYVAGFGLPRAGWLPIAGCWAPAEQTSAAPSALAVDEIDLAALAAAELDPLGLGIV